MRNQIVLFLIIGMIFLAGCGKKDSDKSKIDYIMEDGIKTLHNSNQPLFGELTLELKEVFRLKADQEMGHSFGRFVKDDEGNLFIRDYQRSKILKFNKEGEFLFEFGSKGEGPGEFRFIRSFKTLKDRIVVWGSRKIAHFDLDGKLLEEKKIKKYYNPVAIISADRFVVNFFLESGEGSDYERIRICALIDSDEKVITTYFTAKDLGRTEIRKKNFNFRFSSSAITKDINFIFNPANNLIYCYYTNRYKIFIKDLAGNTQMVFTRPWENQKIKENDAKKIVEMFQNLNPELKDMIIKNLPDKLCAISQNKGLPNGYQMIYAIRGVEDYEINLFDNQGRFLYIVHFPEGFDLTATRYFDNKIAGIRELEEGDVYLEYEITNYNTIFI